MDNCLPSLSELDELLGCTGSPVAEQLERRLVDPARVLLSRQSKHMRARLVALAYDLAGGGDVGRQLVDKAAAALEQLHTGSLIVDDIQDGSKQRRGGHSLHTIYGVPTALCAGNWLYFRSMRILDTLPLPDGTRHRLLTAYYQAVEAAHYGQALDINVKVDTLGRHEVPALCDAVIEWKTGTITALAMRVGAILAGADEATEEALADFGMAFGKTLQYCDDIGNVVGRRDPSKRFEDLQLRKPTAVWAMAAARSTDDDYAVFRAAALRVEDDAAPLITWLEERGFVADATVRLNKAMRLAIDTLAQVLAPHALEQSEAALTRLRDLTEELIDAY
ncbi:MAG: hypothetical protein RL011_2463 [Pseudomonadota bacterium]